MANNLLYFSQQNLSLFISILEFFSIRIIEGNNNFEAKIWPGSVGTTESEREEILNFKDLQSLKINNNILRSETAAISMISIVSFNLLS